MRWRCARSGGYYGPVRFFGALLLLAAAVVGALGAAWTTLAIVGTEWDYCPTGNDCIPGELVGLTIVTIGVIAGFSGFRLVRSR
jgi:hypothetical protein